MPQALHKLAARWPIAAVVGGLLLIAALLYGCGTREEFIIESAGGEDDVKCARLLESGVDMARPTSLGLVGLSTTLRSTPADAAELLSQWLRRDDCRTAAATEPLGEEDARLIERVVGPEGLARITSERVSPFDAAHVRDALLDYSAATSIAGETNDELDRVMRLFDEVARTVTVQGPAATELPLLPYEAQLFGRGSAEDRAWLFANLLRQLKIDAVIIRPAASEGGETDLWWVGVLTADAVFLFDPALGLPVPAPDAPAPAPPALLPRPATWQQAVENPGLLTGYRREAGLEAPDLSPERLRAATVELIGSSTFWTLALERLELSMTADLGVLLYDPLHDTQAGPGLVRRVADAPGATWTEAKIAVWQHPERVRSRRSDLSDSDRQRIEQRLQPHLGPVEPHLRTGVVAAHRRLWETRIEHMSGRPASAIGSYLGVRQADVAHPELSAANRALNAQAADEAFYWVAHAQYGAGFFDAAISMIDQYVRQGGDRAEEALALRALCLAAQGKSAEAAAAVAELPETTPGLPRLRWLSASLGR